MKQLKKIILKFPQIYLYYKKMTYFFLAFLSGTKEKNIFQEASTTEYNRHPDLFKFLEQEYKNNKIKILSFGCSSGEECVSIKSYLPNAKILGIDINKKNIEKAKKNNNHKDISYEYCEPHDLIKLDQFDVILAISVLCKHPEAEYVNNLKKIYPFNRYENMIKKLDSLIKKDGLLIIRGSNYIFRDTETSNNYRVIKNSFGRTPNKFPKFDKNSSKIFNYSEKEEIFQKIVN